MVVVVAGLEVQYSSIVAVFHVKEVVYLSSI
jgi:hypothetical protein